MAVTTEDLAEALGMPGVPADSTALDRTLATARAEILPHLIVTPPLDPDVQAALDSAVLKYACDMWRWMSATGGIYMFSDAVDTPVYMPRDLIENVWPMLMSAGLVSLGSIA